MDFQTLVICCVRIYDENGEMLLADLTKIGRRVVLVKDGNGGAGNTHFKTSTNRAPRQGHRPEPVGRPVAANPGQRGEEHPICRSPMPESSPLPIRRKR